MKLNLIYIFLIILTSCESHEKQVDNAFDKVKESKLVVKDTAQIIVVPEKEPEEKKITVKNEITDAWTQFKNETEKKIKISEAKINELKLKKDLADNKSKFDKQITKLEQKNNDLRKRMNDYNQEEKVKWEKFKSSMNHDIDEIGLELKDVTINNKKQNKK